MQSPPHVFFERIDNTFDCFNSVNEYDNRKPLKSALKYKNNVWNYLEETDVYLKSIDVPTNVAWINALIQTINTLLMLATEYLNNENLNVRYILTKNKNSDCIENFFAIVRGFNG